MTSSLQSQRDDNRMAAIQAAVDAGLADETAGVTRLQPNTLRQAQAIAAGFESALLATAEAVEERGRCNTAMNETFGELRCQVRRICRTLRLAVTQKQMAPVALVHYGVDKSGFLDQPRRRSDWIDLAQSLVEGSRTAPSVGHPPARFGSKLAATLEATIAAGDALKAAHDAVNQARTGLATMRIETDRCLSVIEGELHRALQGTPGPQQLQVLCAYGVSLHQTTGHATAAPSSDLATPTPVLSGLRRAGVGSQM